MHVISAQSIPFAQRRVHIARYLSQARIALRDPSLSGMHRQKLEARVARLQAEMTADAG